MAVKISKGTQKTSATVEIFDRDNIKGLGLSKEESTYISQELENNSSLILLQHLSEQRYFVPVSDTINSRDLEALRMRGNEIQAGVNRAKGKSVMVLNHTKNGQYSLLVAEGIALGNYQFLKYFNAQKSKRNSLENLYVQDKNHKGNEVEELFRLVDAVYLSRNLVNEPLSFLTAVQFSKEMQNAGKSAGFKVEVLHKKQIEALKMGGLLAVNRGSIDPPTFTIMEYKPKNAKNKKPIVLVGKGVVFDTGGLSLKPTPSSMDEMKCDMAGAAAVIGAITAIASNKLPVHVVALVPATDNRPGMNAVVPQDVITISDGTTVEVLNTDAEGRLILSDALVYAKKYKPELCIDLATLTGSAVRAIGTYASAIMGTADEKVMKQLGTSGMNVWERTIEFPMWQEYGDEIKSDVADIKNLGLGNAGHISAGKFLEHFTNYPWIHIDIAGPAYQNGSNAYRTKGGTGVGVRLLYDFIKKNYC